MVDVPAQPDKAPSVTLPDGSSAALTEDYQLTGSGSPDQEWTLTVRKVISGGTEPLRGAVIGLYAGPACQDPIKTGQSGQDGTILFSGLIRGQHYWIKEIQAPSGYELDSSAYEADETAPSVTVANTPTAPPVNPEEPGGPTGPTDPADPADPPDPGNPGVPGGSGTSGRPSTSGRPAVPSASIEPGMPGEPETAGEPGTSGEPGTASESGTSGEPGTTGEPGTSGESGGLEDRGGGMELSGYDPNIPQTGDDTGYLTALTLLSGILLAAMTFCQWLSRKRSKNPHS